MVASQQDNRLTRLEESVSNLTADVAGLTVDFATDSTAHSSIGTTGRTFDDAGDWLRAMWIGGSWRLIDHSGTTAYA